MRWSVLAALAVGPLIAWGWWQKDALSYVRAAVLGDSRTTYTCIREWTSWGSKESVRVRRDQRADGANKVIVLSPISKQGFTIIDDGKQRATYNPDKRELTLQDSPLRLVTHSDNEKRVRLLAQNYRIQVEGEEKVGGRQTRRVRLEPNAKDALFARWFWIDKEKNVLLRVRYRDPSGKTQVMSDTISIEFPSELPKDTFARRFVGELREIQVQTPRRQKDLSKLAEAVGFVPVTPVQMPFGMTYVGSDAILGRNRTMAAVRYTDGAANLTVYQAASTGEPPWRREPDQLIAMVDGVWLTVDGDLPRVGKTKVLEALKASTRPRFDALCQRAASQFGSEITTVNKLLGKGLDLDAVVLCLAAGEPNAYRMASRMLDGYSLAAIARELKLDESKIRAAQKKFWDMQQEVK